MTAATAPVTALRADAVAAYRLYILRLPTAIPTTPPPVPYLHRTRRCGSEGGGVCVKKHLPHRARFCSLHPVPTLPATTHYLPGEQEGCQA